MASEKPWLANYDKGVPHNIDPSLPRTICEYFDLNFHNYQDRTAIQSPHGNLRYAELESSARDLSAYLQSVLGLAKGDRIALAVTNIPAFAIATVAHVRSALLQVNVNPFYTPPELLHQLNDADCDTIVISRVSIGALLPIVAETKIKTVIYAQATGAEDPLPQIDGVEVVAIDDALAIGASQSFEKPKISEDDLLFLQYTGGTTGASKGVMLSHGNMAINVSQFMAILPEDYAHEQLNVITALPLYHIFALMANLLSHLIMGGKIILIENPTDMPGFIQTMKDHPPGFFTGVNTLYNGLIHTPGIEDVDFSGLKLCVGGGAPVQQIVADGWKRATGKIILHAYGLSETSPLATINPYHSTRFSTSVGLPASDTEIEIRDDDGNTLPIGQEGEVCIKGPQVMLGYWRNELATDDVMTQDGFLCSGDIGVMDDGGFVSIVDRKKDMILVSAFNVYPNEIEDVVVTIPEVLECACIGVPDDTTGEAVAIFIVLKPGADLSEDAVVDYCRERLTAYKVPKQIKFLEALPKSSVGKILRRELR